MSDSQPKIIGFYCSNCATSAMKISDGMHKSMPRNVVMVQVPCTGRIETLHLLKPFEEGADGVYIAGCREDSCQYMAGITKAAKRVAQARKILEETGVSPERIAIYNLSAAKGYEFVDIAWQMTEKVKALGPLAGGGNA